MKKLFLLTVFCFLFSCDEKAEVPEGLLSESKMVEILIDVRIAESQATSLNIKFDSARVVFKALEKRLFEKHGIDSTVYKESYQYYMLNPEKALEISNVVLDSLKLMQERETKK